MAATRDSLLDLVSLAYDAALEPSLWPQAIADAGRVFEAPHVLLGVLDRRGGEHMRAATQNATEANMARFSTFETNPGVAFVALTPRPRSSRATHWFRIPISSGCSSTRRSCVRSIRGTWRS
jgi:hypothetical protein